MGLIGLGNIGQLHADYLQAGEVEGCELLAVADRSEALLEPFSDLDTYTDAYALIESADIDAVLVAAPSFLHRPLGEAALERGLHLLMEKPLATHKADGQRMLDACGPEQVFGLMMNLRANPVFRRVKAIMDAGEIGEIQRINWVMTDWFRPEVYFQTSEWRATWRGEGGGVLMNQCPHNIDIMYWLCGMPARVRAYCNFGKYHDIEVEDEVTAYWEYPNGATGSLIASTGEASGLNRLEIAGDKGFIVLQKGKLTVTRYSESTVKFNTATDEMFGMPEARTEEFARGEDVDANPHPIITQNFVRGITEGEKLIAPAKDGLKFLDLAGAMLYSTWNNAMVELPLDAEAVEEQLRDRISRSKPRKVLKKAAKVDMSKSFSR